MFNRCSCILYLTIIICSSVRGDDIGRIGDALEVGNPCNNYIITVERLIGGPPDRENYWDGTVNLQNYKNLTEAVITLYLTAPADVEVDGKDGQLVSNGDPYKMTFFRSKDDVFNAKFHVRPLSKENYPVLKGLLLNDENICPNLQEEPMGHQTIPDIQPECGHPHYMEENEHSSYATIYQNHENSWRYKCAGIYIAPQYVLTTGRCVTQKGASFEPEHLSVRISQLSGQLKNHSVFSVKVHDKYNNLDHSADIALLHLKGDIDDPIRSVCLWNSLTIMTEHADENQSILVTKNHDSNELIKNKASIVASNKCFADDKSPVDGVICAEFKEHVDICDAVEGSGLFTEKEHRFYLRGLISRIEHQDNESNCRNIKHSIFVDVGEYANWIRENSR